MTHKDLHDALDRAADPVGEVDLVDAAWGAGRAQRTRRRTAIGVGGAIAAAAVVGAVALSGGLQQQGSPDPAGTPGPSGTQAEPDGTPTAGESDGSPTAGERVALVFGDDGAWEYSGELEPASADQIAGGQWQLMDLTDPADGVDPAGLDIRLTFGGDQWAVRACGLDMRATGTVDQGSVAVTGDWEVVPDPDPETSCGDTPWPTQGEWQELLESGPVLTVDGATLVMTGWVGDTPELVEAAMAFATRGDSGPQPGSPTPATLADLEQDWVEVAAVGAAQVLGNGPWIDVAPDQAVQLLVGDEVLAFEGCNEIGWPAYWLNGADLIVDPAAGWTTLVGCPDGPGQEDELVQALLGSGPDLRLDGDYLVVTGQVPADLLEVPEDSAATSEDASEGPTQSPEWGPLAVAESVGGDHALISGTIQITDRCVLLDEGGDAVLLVWPHEGTTWDGEEMAVELVGRSGERAVLQDGDQVSFGGGGSSVDEDGTTASDFLESVTWISEPHRECVGDVRWFVGELANLDGS